MMIEQFPEKKSIVSDYNSSEEKIQQTIDKTVNEFEESFPEETEES